MIRPGFHERIRDSASLDSPVRGGSTMTVSTHLPLFLPHAATSAVKESAEGKYILIIGNPDHPEVAGIRGWAGSDVSVIQNAGDIEKVDFSKNKKLYNFIQLLIYVLHMNYY